MWINKIKVPTVCGVGQASPEPWKKALVFTIGGTYERGSGSCSVRNVELFSWCNKWASPIINSRESFLKVYGIGSQDFQCGEVLLYWADCDVWGLQWGFD